MRYTILTFVCFFAYSLTGQNILTVRQGFDDGVTLFSNLQDAVSAANSSDIIQVYPGVYADDVYVDKAIRIIGPGYLIPQNFPGNSTENMEADIIGSFTIAGDEGVLIEGLKIRTLHIISASNAIVRRCWVFRAQVTDSNVELQALYLSGGRWNTSGGPYSENQLRIVGVCNVGLLNCIFPDGYASAGRESLLSAGDTANGSLGTLIIDRCFFRNSLYCGRLAVIIRNSLAYDRGETLSQGVSYNRYNNFVNGSWGGNNIFVSQAGWNALMAGYPTNTNNMSFDARLQLAVSSSARGAADDGGDCGPFGGDFPYLLSGLPAVPFIYDFDVPQEGTTGGGININVKVRTQN